MQSELAQIIRLKMVTIGWNETQISNLSGCRTKVEHQHCNLVRQETSGDKMKPEIARLGSLCF
jgi:hypothetical protein